MADAKDQFKEKAMEWIGILIISPLWGIISTQLFVQAWLAVASLVIYFLGFVRGSVSRKDTLLMMGVALLSMILFSLLLGAGFWVLDLLPFGRTLADTVVYWFFAVISMLFFILQIPKKIRKSWRDAMIPGAFELDIIKRTLGLNPEDE